MAKPAYEWMNRDICLIDIIYTILAHQSNGIRTTVNDEGASAGLSFLSLQDSVASVGLMAIGSSREFTLSGCDAFNTVSFARGAVFFTPSIWITGFCCCSVELTSFRISSWVA